MKPKASFLIAVFAALSMLSAVTAGVVFSESFEAPVVTGFDDNTVPSGGKWIGSTDGFGATNRGLYNESFSWPATAAFTTPYGSQAYFLNYSNSGLTTSVGATGQSLTAGVTYKLTFNAAVTAGTTSGNHLIQLVAFGPTEDNTARADANGTVPGTVLASASGPVTTTNMSAGGTITFTPDGANAHLGKDVGIRILKSTNSVLYDNIRLVTGHDMLPSPASGTEMPAGNTTLSWTNMPPNAPGGNVPVDVWFGTNPATLAQVVDGQLISSTNVNAPGAGTYYWRVDSYPDGDPNGTPVTGDLLFFVVTDSDGDGLPDAYELANTNPASATGLNPASDLDTDGLTAAQEYYYGTDPNDPDTDNDTLSDGPELAGVGARPATSPVDADSDDDGLSDGVETNTGTWVSAANTGTNPTDADWDKDGLKDGAETNTGTYVDRFITGTNPYVADTDNDGATDWYEATAAFTNPSSSAEKPNVPYPLPDPVSIDLGAADKPVKVYIMAGQSNTVGIGQTTGTLPGTLETITKRENKFPNLIDGTGNWTKRNDVIYKGVVSATAAGPLTAGQGASSTQLGPELGFGQIMGWYHDEPVVIIKASQGNRSLAWDFCPPGNGRWTYADKTYAAYGESPGSWLTAGGGPSPGGSWYAGKQYDDCFLAESEMGMSPWATGTAYPLNGLVRHNGAAYTCKLAHTSDSSSEPGVGASWSTYWNVYTITNAADILNFNTGLLQNLPTTGNNLNGRAFQIAGFCWWQGHKDQDGSNNPYATRYEPNLVQLINALRTSFRAPGAPVVVATIGFGGEPLSTKENDFKQVFNAQMAVGNPTLHPEFAETVKSVDILKYWRTIAESPRNQDYHYNQNAETYMLVGDAMGRAMLEMQDDTAPPAPSPMTFAIEPTAVNATTVGMVATTATDVSGPVEYYFENTSNSTNSGWTTSTRWDCTGLANGVSQDFRVKARDAKGNETAWSATASIAPGNDTTAPSPDPMTFATLPAAQGENAISMTATGASDINGVEYYFDCTVGAGPDSGWQSSPAYTATGLTAGTAYTYVVRARDSLGNTTGDSAPASATTTAPDTSAPTPDPMTFATPPTAIGTNAITMTATSASDDSAVEYHFEAVGGGTSSGWQNSASYTDSSLSPGTEYGYRVQARDKSPAKNTTGWSDVLTATTEVPDTTPPTPDPMTFSIAPSATGPNSVTMTASSATAPNGVEYWFTNVTLGTNSGWQTSPVFTDTGLDPETEYVYQVKARDTSENFNETAFSPAAAVTTSVPPVGPGGAVIYEPFEQAAGTIHNKAGGVGLNTWTSTSSPAVSIVSPPTLTYGNLSPMGGQANLPNDDSIWAAATTTTALKDAGLLDDGATLWFSYVFRKTAHGGSNEHSGFAFASERVSPAYNGLNLSATGYGLGVFTNGNTVAATSWSNSTSRTAGTGSVALQDSTPETTANDGFGATLVIGKIEWGAAEEKLTVFTRALSDYATEPSQGGSTRSVTGFDQKALLDTISFGQRNSGGTHSYDEIRFGSSYLAAIGMAGAGPVDSFEISPIASPQTVGTPITGITITAKDASNNTATGFTGTVTLGGTGGFSGTSASFNAGVLSGVTVTPMVAGSNLTLTVDDGAGHTGSATIATINPAQNAYDSWANQITDVNKRGRGDDADGDGFNNGQEFLFGTSPVASNGSLTTTAQSGANLVIRWKQRETGATYTLQQSEGLADDWAAASGATIENDGTASGGYQPRKATVAIGSGKAFFRVRGVEN